MSVSDPKDGASDAPEELVLPQPTARDPRFDTERIGVLIDGRYRILEVVGRGGMGTVYKAEHEAIRRIVALKLLHAPLAQVPEVSRRFEREAFAIGRIEHPNCVNVSDFGRLPDGSLYLVMEYLEGHALSDELAAKGRLPAARTLHILRHVLRGLGHAHTHEIVHRDVKPENVVLIEQGGDPDFAKILDFGIAKLIGTAAKADGGGTLTQAGMAFGTPLYMSPEQALGQPIDGRADLYSASIMAYEMITGQTPFRSEDKIEVMSMHATRPVPPMHEVAPHVEVPPSVEELLSYGLAKRVDERFANADAYVVAIDALLAELAPVQTPPPSTLLATSSPLAPMTGPVPVPPTGLEQPPMAPPSGPRAPLTPTAQQPRRRRLGKRGMAALAGAGVLLLALVLAAVLLPSASDSAAEVVDAGPAGAADELVEQVEALLARGAHRQAIELFEQNAELLAERADAHMLRGHAHAALRHYRAALAAYDKALTLDPAQVEDPALRGHLELIYALEGDDDKLPTPPVDAAALLYENFDVAEAGDRIVDWASNGLWHARRRHAVTVAEELGLDDRIDWVSNLINELPDTEGCQARKEVVTRLGELGDPRALEPLRGLEERANPESCVYASVHEAVQRLESASADGSVEE